MNTEDIPTVPGRPLSNLRIHRAYERTFEDMAFDRPVNATMYVGTRKSVLNARRFERTVYIWMAAATAGAFALVMTMLVNSL